MRFLFLGSAGAGVLVAYGIPPATLAVSVMVLATPVLATVVARGLAGTEDRHDSDLDRRPDCREVARSGYLA